MNNNRNDKKRNNAFLSNEIRLNKYLVEKRIKTSQALNLTVKKGIVKS